MSLLREFCNAEAKYRVCDEISDYEGFETIKDYLESNGEDVDMFIENLTEELFELSESWIDSDIIDNIMFGLAGGHHE